MVNSIDSVDEVHEYDLVGHAVHAGIRHHSHRATARALLDGDTRERG